MMKKVIDLNKRNYELLINGKLVPSLDEEVIPVHNPADESIVAYAAKATAKDADLAVKIAHDVFRAGHWASTTPRARAEVLYKLADLLEASKEQFLKLLMMESGSTYGKAMVEISATIEGIRTYADLCVSDFVHDIAPSSGGPASVNMIYRVPVGVCVGIIPWNWPLYLTMWKMAPAITAGNCIIIKAPDEACLSVLALGELSIKAGLPPGVFQVINGDGLDVGQFLVKHPLVNKISFTGSTATGKRIMQLAADTLKRVTLELGGKSAQIFLEDADLDISIDGALFSGFNHSGQTCHNGSRLLVPRKNYDLVVSRLIDRAKKIRVGNPLRDGNVGMGPIISKKQLDKINEYISIGIKEGAKIVTGGGPPVGRGFTKGYWLSPTIMIDVTNDMRIAREEIFGPLIVVIPYDTLEEAINLANDSPYGLAGNIWSSRLDIALDVAKRIQSGTIWINDASLVNINAPFGGFKHSGLGRESGLHGLLEYTELQHLHLGISPNKSYYSTLFTKEVRPESFL
jgi:aldehyde dehydrogenase (NAD+)